MKAAFEKVVLEDTSSVALLDRRLANGIPFEWHHHPEFELTLTLNSRGHRLVGDHAGGYDDGDLVLVGPNLPHSWCSHEAIDPAYPHVAIVSWFSEAWMEQLMHLMPELGQLRKMLEEARRGVQFSPLVARRVRPQIERLPAATPDERLLLLLQVLRDLSIDPERVVLAAPTTGRLPALIDARLRRVLDHLHAKFDQPLGVAQLAEIACLTPSALHRLFRRHTHMTPIEYVTHLRIGRACSMLIEKDISIATVADMVGYRNLANFNRQFRELKGATPREFRGRHRPAPPRRSFAA